MSRVQTRVHYDSDGSMIIDRVQDVEGILEHNKQTRAMEQRSDWGREIATIPNVILERWINEDGVNYLAGGEDIGKLIKRKLRDPDWAYLRTTDKRF